MPADIVNSDLSARAPELVTLVVLVSFMLAGFWRIWVIVQRGQGELLAQVSASTASRDDKFSLALKEQQHQFVQTLERLEQRRENGETKLGAAVERAADKTSSVIAENTRSLVENHALMLRVVQLLDRVESRQEDHYKR